MKKEQLHEVLSQAQLARDAGAPKGAELVAAECVGLAETKYHLETAIGAARCSGPA
jgi:hypothetical protein